jgi:hypothetical protein
MRVKASIYVPEERELAERTRFTRSEWNQGRLMPVRAIFPSSRIPDITNMSAATHYGLPRPQHLPD